MKIYGVSNEIYEISKIFVSHGVDKIRLTGGEPSVRKDFPDILKRLSSLPVKLSLTTNAVSIDRYVPLLKLSKTKSINVSLDTLNSERFKKITEKYGLPQNKKFWTLLKNLQRLWVSRKTKEKSYYKLNKMVKNKKHKTNGTIDFINGQKNFLSKSIYNVVPRVGELILFPNYLMHTAYPFNVSGERRSFSFNTKIVYKK